jgi:hypothetical protein
VKTYSQFLSGEVYGYIVEMGDENVDSCWGFYGLDDTISEAKSVADYVNECEPELLARYG